MRYSLLYYRSTLLPVRNLGGRKGHADNGLDALMLTVNRITSAYHVRWAQFLPVFPDTVPVYCHAVDVCTTRPPAKLVAITANYADRMYGTD